MSIIYVKITAISASHSIMMASFLQDSLALVLGTNTDAFSSTSPAPPEPLLLLPTSCLPSPETLLSSSRRNRPALLLATIVTVDTIQPGGEALVDWSFRSSVVRTMAKVASTIESRKKSTCEEKQIFLLTLLNIFSANCKCTKLFLEYHSELSCEQVFKKFSYFSLKRRDF